MVDQYRPRDRRYLVARCSALLIACAAFAGMQTEQSDSDRSASPSAQPSRATSDASGIDGVATIVSLVLVGVLLVGLALIAMTILLGNRTRREAKKPLPKQTTHDELWFLRSKPAAPDDSQTSDDDNEDELE